MLKIIILLKVFFWLYSS